MPCRRAATERPADAVDVLLVVGPRRAHELRRAAEHAANGRRRAAGHGAVAIRHGRPYFENISDTVSETRSLVRELVQQLAYHSFHAAHTLFDEQPTVDDHAAGVRYQGRRISGGFRLPTVNRIDVQSRMTGARRHHRHIRATGCEFGIQIALEALDHGVHLAHGAIAEKRHRAMRHPPVSLYLGPPHAAMTDADAINIERFGNDDMIDARRGKPAALRQIMHSAVPARLFIDGTRNLERPRQCRGGFEQCLHRDDGSREPALHIAGAPAIDSAVLHHGRERVEGPPAAALHDIDMAVEMHAGSGRLP
jgi:hypothetical protein